MGQTWIPSDTVHNWSLYRIAVTVPNDKIAYGRRSLGTMQPTRDSHFLLLRCARYIEPRCLCLISSTPKLLSNSYWTLEESPIVDYQRRFALSKSKSRTTNIIWSGYMPFQRQSVFTRRISPHQTRILAWLRNDPFRSAT